MYDLIVLGGGPAGYLAAERASENGLSVCLIEKRFVGGVCLNEGCIPTKTLLYSAKLYHGAAIGEKYGVFAEKLSLDHKTVLSRKEKVVSTLVGGIKAKLRKLKVELVDGEGVIGHKTAEGFTVSCLGKEYVGKRLLIATGSSPVVPPITGLKEKLASGFVMTNREILQLKEIPKKLTVIGGGVIGLEMASYFNTAGSEVTVVEMLDKIAGPTDREISEILKSNYEKEGVKFLLGAKVTGVTDNTVEYECNGEKNSVSSQKVLLSIGRRANTAGIGLENIGVYTERGAIKTDELCRTNVANVYAAGDVNGVSMLAHTAYRESEVAVSDMLGKRDRMSYDAIPSVIYTNPEVGAVGVTEEQAKASGKPYKCVKLTMNYSGRYVAENEGGDGIIKLIADTENKTIIGCHVIGNYASEFILSATIMIDRKLRIDDIRKVVFPHPTVCEAIREALFTI